MHSNNHPKYAYSVYIYICIKPFFCWVRTIAYCCPTQAFAIICRRTGHATSTLSALDPYLSWTIPDANAHGNTPPRLRNQQVSYVGISTPDRKKIRDIRNEGYHFYHAIGIELSWIITTLLGRPLIDRTSGLRGLILGWHDSQSYIFRWQVIISTTIK